MLSNEFEILIDQLNQQGKMKFLDGATDTQIQEFEKKYDTRFPVRFKEWLRFSDGGEFFLPAGIQMYGVAHKPVIDVADDDRPNKDYIVIGALASGDPILCDAKGERISIYNHEAGRIETDEIYEDFFTFLNELHEILGIGG